MYDLAMTPASTATDRHDQETSVTSARRPQRPHGPDLRWQIRFTRRDAALFIYTECCTHSLIVLLITLTSGWFKAFLRLASLINEDLGLSDHPGDGKICYSLIMSFQMNMFSFWKYYLGKTGCQWPPAGFNDLTFRSTSSQPCVVWCPRAAGRTSEDVRGGFWDVFQTDRKYEGDCGGCFNCVPGWIQNHLDLTDWCSRDWFGWWQQDFFIYFFKQKLTPDLIHSFLASP